MQRPLFYQSFNDDKIAIIYFGNLGELRAGQLLTHLSCVLALPYNKNPAFFHWPVNGLEIYLVNTSPCSKGFVEYFCKILFSHGATEITYISKQSNFTLKRSFQ